jgi:hypothetical protein
MVGLILYRRNKEYSLSVLYIPVIGYLTMHVFVISGVRYSVRNDAERKAVLFFTKYDN